MAWIFLAFLALACAANYALHRDLMYPGLIQAALWTFVALLLALFDDTFITVGLDAWLLVVFGALAFSAGNYFATRDHQPFLRKNYVHTATSPRSGTLSLAMAVGLVGAIAIAVVAWELARAGPSLNLAINLRLGRTEGGYGLVAYFFPAIYAISVAAVIRAIGPRQRVGLSRGHLVAVIIVGAAVGVLSTARGSILLFLFSMIGVPLILRRVSTLWVAVVGGALLLLVFGAGAILLLKGGSTEMSWTENLSAIAESLIVYTAGSVPALGKAMGTSPPLEWGANTFRFFAAVANGLGLDVHVAPLVQEFTNVPQRTNVYTMYYQYFRDFGTVGAVAFQFFFGLGHGVLYRRATEQRPDARLVFLFAVSLFPLLTQHFTDGYMSLFSSWLQYGIYAYLLFESRPVRSRRRPS